MANQFPYMSTKHWWMLRSNFQKRLPTRVDPDYLQSTLAAGETYAKEVKRNLRLLGLIDDENKPTELANAWRMDEDYQTVCKKILETAYPDALRDAFPGPFDSGTKQSVINWFMRNARVSVKAARKLAGFYILLSKANPMESPPEGEKPKRRSKPVARKRVLQRNGSEETHQQVAATTGARRWTVEPVNALPSLHIDIQIHIAADAKPEQIDQIFASMARHLYGGILNNGQGSQD